MVKSLSLHITWTLVFLDAILRLQSLVHDLAALQSRVVLCQLAVLEYGERRQGDDFVLHCKILYTTQYQYPVSYYRIVLQKTSAGTVVRKWVRPCSRRTGLPLLCQD